jgi:hypothetical protein
MCGKGQLRGIVAERYAAMENTVQVNEWVYREHGIGPPVGTYSIHTYWQRELHHARIAYGEALRTYERLLRREE